MHPMLNIAIRAARKAGDLIAKYYETPDGVDASPQGNNDFTGANIEREAERLIIEIIHKFYPLHTIIGKKYGELIDENHDVKWIIIPLDGTINFIKRFPHFAVSIAVRIKGHTEIAVIYDPIRNELFSANRGQGAQLNGYRLRGSTARDLNNAILAINFPFKQKQDSPSYIMLLSKLFIQCADFRCSGSNALDLAYIAAGRIDGFFKIILKPCDCFGGELLVREAGGLVTDFKGGHNYLLSGNLVSGNPRMVKAMLSVIRDKLSEEMKG
ncbi:MAG: inositol-phosphate phosphatase [Sodalis sp. Fle]|nr:MAG: inositol-phosphate phosphatase [Sodalis sp. Fle]